MGRPYYSLEFMPITTRAITKEPRLLQQGCGVAVSSLLDKTMTIKNFCRRGKNMYRNYPFEHPVVFPLVNKIYISFFIFCPIRRFSVSFRHSWAKLLADNN